DDKKWLVAGTQAKLERRGDSRVLRKIWDKLKAMATRPAFGLIIDEAAGLARKLVVTFYLGRRYPVVSYRDGPGGEKKPLQECPAFAGNGDCSNCFFSEVAAEIRYDRFGLPNLRPLPVIRFDEDGKDRWEPDPAATLKLE